jgi:hypothetical protein
VTRPPAKSDLTSLVKEYALELGFDLVRVTSAAEFAADRQIALERIQDGLMDGLTWYSRERA